MATEWNETAVDNVTRSQVVEALRARERQPVTRVIDMLSDNLEAARRDASYAVNGRVMEVRGGGSRGGNILFATTVGSEKGFVPVIVEGTRPVIAEGLKLGGMDVNEYQSLSVYEFGNEADRATALARAITLTQESSRNGQSSPESSISLHVGEGIGVSVYEGQPRGQIESHPDLMGHYLQKMGLDNWGVDPSNRIGEGGPNCASAAIALHEVKSRRGATTKA